MKDLLILVITIALSSVVINAQPCGPEDCADVANSPVKAPNITPLATMQIGVPTIPLVHMDFEAMAPGATSLADIQAAFPTADLAGISVLPRAGSGTYDFQTFGTALGNQSGGGSLGIIPVGGSFGNLDQLRIIMNEETTEVGFTVGDWSGSFNIGLYDDGFSAANLVGTEQVSTSGNNGPFYIQSDVVFDRFILTALPEWPAANWVIPDLYLPEATPPEPDPIPTLSQWGLFLFGLTFVTLGLVLVYKRQTAMALAGEMQTRMQRGSLPFDMDLFKRCMTYAIGIGILGFGIIQIGWGEILPLDILGVTVSIPVIAYMIHMFKMFGRR